MLELLLSDILRDATCPLTVPLGGGELLMAYGLYGVGRTYTHAPGVGGVEAGGTALSSPHLAVGCSDLAQRLCNQ